VDVDEEVESGGNSSSHVCTGSPSFEDDYFYDGAGDNSTVLSASSTVHPVSNKPWALFAVVVLASAVALGAMHALRGGVS
jgi:hypothetical protein